jgi:uncharacterized protein YbcC (UPF0753/DUF2309 family)
MKNALRKQTQLDLRPANEPLGPDAEQQRLRRAVDASWSAIAPFWPLRNLVAVNPLQGLEDLPIESALVEASVWFQQRNLPAPMEAINRETIKWCQAFFDDGQATIAMPLRHLGLYRAWRRLAVHDRRLHGGDAERRAALAALPDDAESAIAKCLQALNVGPSHRTRFMMLLLATLPGWAAHVRYRTTWTDFEPAHPHPVSGAEYLAMRLAITRILWPGAGSLLDWQVEARERARHEPGPMEEMVELEEAYRQPLLSELSRRHETPARPRRPKSAQLVFCIDTRSEPFRRFLEDVGDYETFGFAGFFGVPIRVNDAASGESQASCPVLLEPKHVIDETPAPEAGAGVAGTAGGGHWGLARRVYQSLKHTFTAPFALVETLGPAAGAWMALNTFAPAWAERLRRRMAAVPGPVGNAGSDLADIPVEDRCAYAEGALRTMGMTEGFSRLVVLCGHGSTTRNNAYATALDCGACGGRHGFVNARVLAAILNDPWVREYLVGRGIHIPGTTRFIGALHDTATDQVTLDPTGADDPMLDEILVQLRDDLDTARHRNALRRAGELGSVEECADGAGLAFRRSRDWSEVRPEWGLARNATFIAAPRELTRNLDLGGRAFLHSYDWREDPEGEALALILTAPMVVAQWINAQYLFSTLDNVSFGAGSKVTQNITGKLGVMQGNASDLMHGLPQQSVCSADGEAWHQPLRLMTVVRAPRDLILRVVQSKPELQRLFGNGWVTLACIDPQDGRIRVLQRSLSSWQTTGCGRRP